MTTPTRLQDLYEKDFVAWADETALRLRRREMEELDWEHIIEEIEGLGSSERNKVDSYSLQLLVHLLQESRRKAHALQPWDVRAAAFRRSATFLKPRYNIFTSLVSK
jgi:hypothetical protein